MINKRVYDIQSQEVRLQQDNPLKIIREIKRPPRLRNYTPLIWDNGNISEIKEEKNEIIIKPSGRCVIL